MAITYDASSSGTQSGVGTKSITHICTSQPNRVLVVVTTINVSSMTYAGVNVPNITAYFPPTPPGTNCPPIYIWKLATPTSGSNTLSVVCTDSASIISSSYYGTDYNFNPLFNFFNTDTNNFQVTSTTIGLTTMIDESLVLGLVAHTGNVKTMQAGAATTLRVQNDGAGATYGIAMFDNNAPVTPPALTNETFEMIPGAGGGSQFMTMILWELPVFANATFIGQMTIL